MLSLKWEPLDDTAEPRQRRKLFSHGPPPGKRLFAGFSPALVCDDFQVAAAAALMPPLLFCLLVPRSGLPRHRLVGMEREGESCFLSPSNNNNKKKAE